MHNNPECHTKLGNFISRHFQEEIFGPVLLCMQVCLSDHYLSDSYIRS